MMNNFGWCKTENFKITWVAQPSPFGALEPTGIVLDGDQHLFIFDQRNNRIIGSDENGFRCINDKLFSPQTMSFDSYGNIYVLDGNNHRVQKILKNELYSKFVCFF